MISRLDPVAIASQDEWNLGAGASKWAACSYPHDDATTYLQVVGPDKEELFYVQALPGGAINVSNVDHTIRFRRYAGSAGNLYHRQRYAATSQFCGTAHDIGAWTTYVDSTVARPGGGSWTTDNFGNAAGKAEFGVATLGDAPGDGWYCTSSWVDVTHEMASGGFVYLISLWLPPLLAVASHGLLRKEIASILRSLKYRPSNDEDFSRLLEAFRVRPRFSGLLAPCPRVSSRGPLLALPGAP